MERQGVKTGDVWGQDGCQALTDTELQELRWCFAYRIPFHFHSSSVGNSYCPLLIDSETNS